MRLRSYRDQCTMVLWQGNRFVTYLVVGAARSQRQMFKRRLEQFADELMFFVVKPDTRIAVCAASGAAGETLVVQLRHSGVRCRAKHRCSGRRPYVVKINNLLRRTLWMHKHKLRQQKQQKDIGCLTYFHLRNRNDFLVLAKESLLFSVFWCCVSVIPTAVLWPVVCGFAVANTNKLILLSPSQTIFPDICTSLHCPAPKILSHALKIKVYTLSP